MKIFTSPSLLAAVALSMAGCTTYEHRTIVVEPTPPVVRRQTVITTLPSGYRTRIFRGTTYYYRSRGDVIYRTHPGGGFVVVSRPW